MTTEAAHYSASSTATADVRERGHIGLIVLASIAAGLVLGLVFVLAVLAAARRRRSPAALLVALGAGFMMLALASSRFTPQPQGWALAPGVAAAAVGGGVLVLSPVDHRLRLAAWGVAGTASRACRMVVPRRTPVAPQLVTARAALPGPLRLVLVAVGGVFETVAEATTSNPAPGDGTYLVDGQVSTWTVSALAPRRCSSTGSASITTRAITDVVRVTRSGQPLR